MTTKEAAERLGLSTIRVNQLVQQGRLKAILTGGPSKYRVTVDISESEIERFSKIPRHVGKPRKLA